MNMAFEARFKNSQCQKTLTLTGRLSKGLGASTAKAQSPSDFKPEPVRYLSTVGS